MLAMLARRSALVLIAACALIGAIEHFYPPERRILIHAAAQIELPFSLLDLSAPPEKPAISKPSPYFLDGSTMQQVGCGDYVGSAVYLGSGRYITAAHVVTDESGKPLGCQIAGQPVSIERMDLKIDYAIIRAPHYPPFRASISCERLHEGEIYFASGFADGNPWPVVTRLRATGERERESDKIGGGTADANGSIVRGMSGGGVSDSDGLLHGINDWNDSDGVPVGGVVELADTALCKEKKP